MGVDVEVRPKQRADVGQQVGVHLLRLLEAHGGEGVLLVQDLAAGDLVHPFLVDLQLPQFLGDPDGVAPGAEEGRRRSEESRDGKELVSTCRSRGWQYHIKKKNNIKR